MVYTDKKRYHLSHPTSEILTKLNVKHKHSWTNIKQDKVFHIWYIYKYLTTPHYHYNTLTFKAYHSIKIRVPWKVVPPAISHPCVSFPWRTAPPWRTSLLPPRPRPCSLSTWWPSLYPQSTGYLLDHVSTCKGKVQVTTNIHASTKSVLNAACLMQKCAFIFILCKQ